MKLLELEDVHIFHGLGHTIFGISLVVNEGETVCVLGRNGAGKTTTCQGIMGLLPPKSGVIRFGGKEITKMPPHIICRLGIGYTPEYRGIFRDLTVRENLMLGARKPGNGGGNQWTLERVYGLFPGLKARAGHRGNELSGGEQQMLAVGRALMTSPRLLLLDEPSQGLAPLLQTALGEQINGLKKEGVTILLSEQSVKLASHVADRVYIIEKGAIRYQGSVNDFKCNPDIASQYLGCSPSGEMLAK